MRPAWFTDDRMELAAVSLRPGGPAGVAATTVVTIEPMADVVISTMDQAAAVLDVGGTIRSASAKLRELLDEQELRGRELITFLHPDDHRVFVDMAFGVDEPGARKARMAEIRVVLTGGRVMTLNASVGRRDHDRSGEFVVAFAEKDNASEKSAVGFRRALGPDAPDARADRRHAEPADRGRSAGSDQCVVLRTQSPRRR